MRNVMNHAPTAGAWRLVAFLKNMRNVMNHAPTAGAWHKKRKESVTKTGSENTSNREKNRDKTVVFTLTCGRFSLFRRSKHSF